MFKRIVLAFAFVAALTAGGLMTNTASAHGYGRYSYGYPGYAAYYPASYYGYYAPRTAYYGYPGTYPVVYRSSYGGGHHRHCDRGGLTVSFGF